MTIEETKENIEGPLTTDERLLDLFVSVKGKYQELYRELDQLKKKHEDLVKDNGERDPQYLQAQQLLYDTYPYLTQFHTVSKKAQTIGGEVPEFSYDLFRELDALARKKECEKQLEDASPHKKSRLKTMGEYMGELGAYELERLRIIKVIFEAPVIESEDAAERFR